MASDSLLIYIREVRRCLRLQALARGLALSVLCALALTVVAVPAAHFQRFTEDAVRWTRLWMVGGSVLALLLLAGIPLLRRWTDRRIARYLEERHPEYQDRITTAVDLVERGATDAEILALLLEDTQRKLATVPAREYLDRQRLLRFAGLGAGSFAILAGLALFGPNMYRHGIGHLWTGWMSRAAGPLYQITVEPGNANVARRTDQTITARTLGFQPSAARIFAWFQNGTRWQEIGMAPDSRGNAFRHAFLDVRENIRYYVEANGVRSPEYRLSVADLPSVRRIELSYHFPAHTGMPDQHEPDGGDIRAVKGTEVQVTVHTEVPAEGGDLMLDSGRSVPLRASSDGKQLTAKMSVEESGLYHVRLGRRGEQPARASDDYVIDSVPDQPPTVSIRRPGRDMQPTSVEEVTAQVEGQDDFGLSTLELRYSVNGGPERQVSLLDKRGARQADGRHTLALEEMKLVPGDVISYYAVARDARQTAQTDIYFMEVRPFEREYRQSQTPAGMGGGGQGEDEGANLVRRQKEIIAATWNLLRNPPDNPGDDIKTLADLQRRLKQQTETVAKRVQARELSGVNRQFTTLVENLNKAAEAMGPAAEQLGARKLKDAMPPEQKALQHLSRAEATFREIQVAFGNNQGGGGRGSANQGRDLADLFDLELDTQKNQYETPQQRQAGGAQQQDEKLDAALRRLQELARRQQQLADQRRRDQQQQPAASRWEQEQLRRQTEELARELDRLARDSNSSEMNAIRQRLEQAAREMQSRGSQSGASGQQSGSQQQQQEEAQRRAMQRLQEARDLLARRRGQEGQQSMQQLNEAAQQIAREQQKAAEEVRRFPAAGEDMQKRNEAFGRAMEHKSKVYDGLNSLEQKLHETARKLAAVEPDAARKLRAAAGTIREEQMQDKVRDGVELLRRGLNQMAAQREEGLRQSLERLQQQIADAQRSLKGQDGSQQANGDRRAERALARAEDLRRRLEQMEARLRQQGQQGQQQGQRGQQQGQQQGQQGQQPGQQSGQQGGQQSAQGQRGGQRGGQNGQDQLGREGDLRAGARRYGGPAGVPEGAWNPGIDRPWNTGGRAPLTPEQRQQMEREYAEMLPQMRELQRELRDDSDFARRTRELVDALSKLEAGRFPGDPAELERLRASVLDGMRQVELVLSRKLNAGGELRLPPHEEIPSAYRRQVEQYYRSLAERKR